MKKNKTQYYSIALCIRIESIEANAVQITLWFIMDYQRNLLCVIVLISAVCLVCDSARRDPRQYSSEECTLPEHPNKGRWRISGSTTTKSPGQKVSSGTVINVSCNGQYTLDGDSLINCNNGQWASKIGKCLELCPPVITTSSTIVTCTANGKSNDKCMKPINGTVATFSCAPFYENADLNRNPFRFCLNGNWNQEIPSCTPVCGVKPTSKRNSKVYFPWNAVVYAKSDRDPLARCSGTLINERTILTAAHCVTNETGHKQPIKNYIVAVGKATAEFQDKKDKDAQYADVLDILMPKGFRASVRKYFDDIAVIITKQPFKMTKRVQPVCIDWSNQFLGEFENATNAWIPGPLLRSYYPSVQNITEIPITIVDETTCYDQLSPNKENGLLDLRAHYTAAYMYCSGYVNSDKVPECLVDHGVGLVTKNQYNNKYYVIGVLNLYPSLHGQQCDNKRWTLYVRVSQYISSLIKQSIDLYTPIQRSSFQTSCGIKSVQAKTLIVNGKNVTKGDYPWQVAIYKIDGASKTLICGGSLLNQRVILTAAHCVTDLFGNTLSTDSYAVAVGKYYRNFDDPRDTDVQFSSLKNIFVPSQYKGEIQNYLADIAVLVTENTFTLSRKIQPVCVDWDTKYETQFLKPSTSGYVSGWGFTQPNRNPSQELKEIKVPYLDQRQCQRILPEDYEVYLTEDKICAGFLEQGTSVCNGDSGGGLVFKNQNDERYYIAGIVSLSPQAPEGGCDTQQIGLYTRVSKYVKEFILEKVRLYWA